MAARLGSLLTGARDYYFRGPHLIYPPGLLISITVLCTYLVGDGLRDALDPRLRGSFGGGVRRRA